MLSGFPYLLAEMNHLPEIPKSLRLLISGGDVLRGAYVDRLHDSIARGFLHTAGTDNERFGERKPKLL